METTTGSYAPARSKPMHPGADSGAVPSRTAPAIYFDLPAMRGGIFGRGENHPKSRGHGAQLKTCPDKATEPNLGLKDRLVLWVPIADQTVVRDSISEIIVTCVLWPFSEVIVFSECGIDGSRPILSIRRIWKRFGHYIEAWNQAPPGRLIVSPNLTRFDLRPLSDTDWKIGRKSTSCPDGSDSGKVRAMRTVFSKDQWRHLRVQCPG